MKAKRKKEKMNTKVARGEKKAAGPTFVKMGAPSILHGNPCCTVRDPQKEKELGKLIESVSAKRKEETA
jgi:hypothetical protein